MIYINGTPALFDAVISIKNKSDFPPTLSSTKLYIIDGEVDLGDTSLEVPANGLYISGHGLNISSLKSSADNYTMFTSPVGGSGDVLFSNLTLSPSGAGSQLLDLVSKDGMTAIEFTVVNFSNCSSLGTVDNYRQGLEDNSGRFGGKPELTLKGEWLGGYRVTTSITRALDSDFTGSLFKAGTGFTMNSRFLSDMNCDLPTNASFADFSPSNFTAPSLVQMRGAIMTRDGQDPQSGDNQFFPNLDPEDLVCSWKDNIGLRNTFEGGVNVLTTEVTTTIPVASTYYDMAGTWTASDLQHFSSPTNGTLQNDGNNPEEFNITASLTLRGTANNSLSIKVLKWDVDLLAFVDVLVQNTTVNSLSGPRDVAFVSLNYNVTLQQGDFIKLQVANLTSASNITCEVGSYYQLNAR